MIFSSTKKKNSYSENIINNFRDNGIITINDLIEINILQEIKKKISKEFRNFEMIDAMNLHQSGILSLIFNKKIRYLINLLIPDGILWHCYYLRTASNNPKPHFNIETRYGTWHRDRIIDYRHERIDFLDIMIYLNDVGENDGAFGFLPVRPDYYDEVENAKKSSKVIGKSGLGILSRIDWWHTATANLGNNDREMIRLSITKNMYHQAIQETEQYIKLREYFKNKDVFLNFMFGGNRKWYKNVQQPKQEEINNISFSTPPLNYSFSKSYKQIIKNKIKSLF